MSGSKKQSHAGMHNVSGLQTTSAMTSLKEYFNPKAQHILADEFDDEWYQQDSKDLAADAFAFPGLARPGDDAHLVDGLFTRTAAASAIDDGP